MRKRLQLAWMLASTVLATSFTPILMPVARAAESNGNSRGIQTTEEHGRRIYVNDDAPAKERPTPVPQAKRSKFAYWSSKESRWKPVPSANTESGRAPRSAAAGVSEFYRRDSVQSANAKILQANSHGHRATPQEIDQSGVPQIAETQGHIRRITHLHYRGLDLPQSGVSRDPLHVQRDERGVLYISNTDRAGKHLS